MIGRVILKKELHVISTGKQSLDNFVLNASQIHPYLDFLHIREPHLQESEVIKLVRRLIKNGVPKNKIIINRYPDVAAYMGVAGVQLNKESVDISYVKQTAPYLHIGCSVHSKAEAIEKEKSGADYVIYGHIFETASKPSLAPRGIEGLLEIMDAVSLPVITIGGITLENVRDVIKAGASGIAVMSAILESAFPIDVVKKFDSLLMRRGK